MRIKDLPNATQLDEDFYFAADDVSEGTKKATFREIFLAQGDLGSTSSVDKIMEYDPLENKLGLVSKSDFLAGLINDISGLASDIADVSNAVTALDAYKALRVTTPSFSSLPTTFSALGVTADMVVAEAVLSNPAAQTDAWTVTTAADSITISGTISGTTTLTLLLVKPSGDITAS